MGASNYPAHLRAAKVQCAGCSTELKPLGEGDWESCPKCFPPLPGGGMEKTKEFAGALTEHFPAEACAEFQVFLSFRNDDDGVFFREWWQDVGAAAFAKWVSERDTEDQ